MVLHMSDSGKEFEKELEKELSKYSGPDEYIIDRLTKSGLLREVEEYTRLREQGLSVDEALTRLLKRYQGKKTREAMKLIEALGGGMNVEPVLREYKLDNNELAIVWLFKVPNMLGAGMVRKTLDKMFTTMANQLKESLLEQEFKVEEGESPPPDPDTIYEQFKSKLNTKFFQMIGMLKGFGISVRILSIPPGKTLKVGQNVRGIAIKIRFPLERMAHNNEPYISAMAIAMDKIFNP